MAVQHRGVDGASDDNSICEPRLLLGKEQTPKGMLSSEKSLSDGMSIHDDFFEAADAIALVVLNDGYDDVMVVLALLL